MPPQNEPDFRDVFRASLTPRVIVDIDLRIVEANNAYLRVGNKHREEVLGRNLFEVFPENPQAPEALSIANLTASFRRVIDTKAPDILPTQRYDTVIADEDGVPTGAFEERYWRPVNRPILDDNGEVRWIQHEVEEITEQIRLARASEDDSPAGRERQRIVRLLRAGNALLQAMPDLLFERLVPHLTPVKLAADKVLVEPHRAVEVAHFPLFGLISISRYLEDGSCVEVAIGGQGGLIGTSAITGEPFDETEARTLVAGVSLRIRARTLQTLMDIDPDLRTALGRFLPVLIDQMSLSAACIARHTLGQRLARWLLTAASRIGSNELPMRQESLAHILGVRRTGISEALTRLENIGIVANSRGRIVLCDTARLEARSCPCFREAEERRLRDAPYLRAHSLATSAEIEALTDRYLALNAA